jgi:hypothetical protein
MQQISVTTPNPTLVMVSQYVDGSLKVVLPSLQTNCTRRAVLKGKGLGWVEGLLMADFKTLKSDIPARLPIQFANVARPVLADVSRVISTFFRPWRKAAG